MILRSQLRVIGAAVAASLLAPPRSGDAFTAASFLRTRGTAPATTSARPASSLSPDKQQDGGGPSPEFFKKMGVSLDEDGRPLLPQRPPPPSRQMQPPPPPQQMQQPQQLQQQFFDAQGNPVTLPTPMVYDANGNLVPYQAPPAASQVPPPPILEPPLPPTTKDTGTPKPVGYNSDAYTMANTADVYFAQLKQDTKVRKIARMSGDVATANKVFADESVQHIKDSWKENPYTKEQNVADARSQIEGTVRMHTQVDDAPRAPPSGNRYKDKLAQMQKVRTSPGGGGGGGGGELSQVGQGEVNQVAPATPRLEQPKSDQPKAEQPKMKQPQVEQPPQQVDMPIVSSIDVEQSQANTPAAPQPAAVAPTPSVPRTMPPLPAQEAVTPHSALPDLDPLAGSAACVAAVLTAYGAVAPEEREALVPSLREAMMAAARASNEYLAVLKENARRARAAAKAAKAAGTPTIPPAAAAASVASPEAQAPTMGFPATYAVTKPKEEEDRNDDPLRGASIAAAAAAVETANVETSTIPPAAAAAATAPTMGFPTTYAVTQPEEEEARDDDPSPPAPVASNTPSGSHGDLAAAVTAMDATAVSSLLQSGLELDEATTDAAFWAVVSAVDRAEALDQPLSVDVPTMLHHIFDADLRHLLTREQIRTNVTCMMPEQAGANRIGMNYIFDDAAHKDLPLEEGRRCEDGTCCDACSRNVFPAFASPAETSLETYPELTGLTFNELEDVSAATILQFTRLIERVRRTIAHEYGLPLASVLPLQAYSRKYVAGTTQQGGGGGEGDFVTLHTDEATHDGYHYSCVLYLSTQGEDFEGGSFIFNDPAPKIDGEGVDAEEEEHEDDEMEDYDSLADQIRTAGRVFTPYGPTRGAAVIFSSGWENMHEVEKITAGTRYCVPCFFTTCPVPDAGYEQMVQGKPTTTEDIADDWLHLLLAHRKEDAHQSLGRVKELLMKWHYICTPLSEH